MQKVLNYNYFFVEKRMSLYRITPSGYPFPVRAYDERDERFRTSDFLAARGIVV